MSCNEAQFCLVINDTLKFELLTKNLSQLLYCRTGHKDAEPFDSVAKVQKRRRSPEQQIHVHKSSSWHSRGAHLPAIFLHSLVEIIQSILSQRGGFLKTEIYHLK